MKSTCIIVEGPDNIGKTHLCQELAALYDGHYMHFGPPTPPTYEQGKKIFFDTFGHIAVNSKIYIMDRSPFGEFVYCQYRKYNAWDYMQEALDFIKDCNINIIYILLYTTKATKKPKKDEVHQYQKVNEMKTISESYLDVVDVLQDCQHKCYTIKCDMYKTFDLRNAYIKNALQWYMDGIK